MRMLYRLGDFGFSMDQAAPTRFSRVSEYRWPAQERVGRESARQFTGPGSDEITLEGVQFPAWRGGVGQVEPMRSMAGQGEPLMLTDGRGQIHGKWCILSVEEEVDSWVPGAGGAPRKQTWRLKLGKYGEDA